jgi:hypothetical protein
MLRAIMIATVMICAAPVAADPMGAQEFEDYTTGKTLYFREDGMTYGAERYLPGRRVEWSFLDGLCKSGEWYPDGQSICFVYEDRPDPQCWEFESTQGGLRATFVGEAAATELYEAAQSDEPLVCLGPEVGV